MPFLCSLMLSSQSSQRVSIKTFVVRDNVQAERQRVANKFAAMKASS